MKQFWRKWSERIDAMSLRERAILFFAGALVLLFLCHAFLIKPTVDRERLVARQLAQKQADTRGLQDQVEIFLRARAQDPDAGKREKLDALKRRLAELDGALAEKQRGLVPPERITTLLEDILRRDRNLQLVDLRSLPATPLFGEKDAAKIPGRARLDVYRHGVELTVRGNYFDLVRYLEQLERLPIRMFWSEVDVTATDYPTITMKLTVYTLSLDRAWLVV